MAFIQGFKRSFVPQTYMHIINSCKSLGMTNAVSVAWLKVYNQPTGYTLFTFRKTTISQYSTKSIKKNPQLQMLLHTLRK